MLENLTKTYGICVDYHKSRGNEKKVKQLQKRMREVKKKNLFCGDEINSDISNQK